MKTRKHFLLLSIILFLFLLGGCAANKESEPVNLPAEPAEEEEKTFPQIGSFAPSFTLKTLEGEEVALEDYRGKIVILNFWGSWCPPCREEMPYLEAFYEEEDRYNAYLLTVNIMQEEDVSPDVIQGFVTQNGYTFPVLLDEGSKVAQNYRVYAIPQTFILDENGRLLYIKYGPFAENELQEVLELIANNN